MKKTYNNFYSFSNPRVLGADKLWSDSKDIFCRDTVSKDYDGI